MAKIPAHIITFVISIMVARLLTPKDYGLVAIAMMIIGYANIFTSFGITEAIIQKGITSKQKINSIFIFNISISLIFLILVVIFSDQIAVFFEEPDLKNIVTICSFVFLITSFESIASSILRRDLRFKVFSLIQIFKSLSSSILTIVLAVLGYGYWSLIYGQIVPSFVFAFILCFKSKWCPSFNANFSGFKELFGFGFWMTLKSSLSFFNDHIDKFLIGKYIGSGGLGIYDMSRTITKSPYDLLTMNINSVMFSEFCRVKSDKEHLKERYLSSLTLISLISFPIYAGIISVSDHFVDAILGENWNEMGDVLKFVASAFFFKSLAGIVSSLNISIGEYKKHTINLIYSSIIFLILCFLLIGYGVIGVSISFLLSSSIYLYLSVKISVIRLSLKYSEILYFVLYPFLYSLIMFVIVVFFSYVFFYDYTILNLLFLIIIGMISYLVLVLSSKNLIIKKLKVKIINDLYFKLGH